MPRRKQDKPQHFEDELETNTADMPHTTDGDGMESDAKENIVADRSRSEKSCDEGSTRHVEDDDNDVERPTMRESRADVDASLSTNEDFGGEAALITNAEWLSVKASLSTLQQQIQMLRLQQFQLMQFLSPKSQNETQSNDDLQESCLDEGNDSDTVMTAVKEEVKDMECNSAAVNSGAQSKDNGDDAAAVAEEYVNAGLHSPLSSSGDTESQKEADENCCHRCPRCSIQLQSAEVLRLHMLSHTELAPPTASPTIDDQPTSANGDAHHAINGGHSSSQSSVGGYQAVIADLTNDDSLEEYMEIQKPENTHLEQLARTMEGTITDPNQCLICKRVLSCKSALMMHYRTHTGERPFKCKLCNRAFTTKGNLKTHMGVHRAKPPVRLLHSCPICNKQFTNALVLNQHMKIHSDDMSNKLNADAAAVPLNDEAKRTKFSVADMTPKIPSAEHFSAEDFRSAEQFNSLPPGIGFPFDFNLMPSMQGHMRYAEVFARQWEQLHQLSMMNPMVPTNPAAMFVPGLPFPMSAQNRTLIEQASNVGSMQEKTTPNHHRSSMSKESEVDNHFLSSTQDEKRTMEAQPLTASPKSERSCSSSIDANSSSGLSTTARLDPPPGTTCDICAKTFACRSALEIHYRSHTKQRPFKCDLCDKAFTTRGNMKQHILTHKTDDMHWASQGKTSPTSGPSPSGISLDRPLSVEDSRTKSSSKHQCSICLKHFSSASAVQIHFRTHTGDRPFKCTVCGKAFTTKGNLKVHMGTHMWNGTTSRRGRRLSADGVEPTGFGSKSETTLLPPVSTNGMNNNSFEWGSLNQAALMKASLLGGPASMMNGYPSHLMLPTSEHSKVDGSRPWLWQATCHICHKECQSTAALELHLKTHLAGESGSPKPVTA